MQFKANMDKGVCHIELSSISQVLMQHYSHVFATREFLEDRHQALQLCMEFVPFKLSRGQIEECEKLLTIDDLAHAQPMRRIQDWMGFLASFTKLVGIWSGRICIIFILKLCILAL